MAWKPELLEERLLDNVIIKVWSHYYHKYFIEIIIGKHYITYFCQNYKFTSMGIMGFGNNKHIHNELMFNFTLCGEGLKR